MFSVFSTIFILGPKIFYLLVTIAVLRDPKSLLFAKKLCLQTLGGTSQNINKKNGKWKNCWFSNVFYFLIHLHLGSRDLVGYCLNRCLTWPKESFVWPRHFERLTLWNAIFCLWRGQRWKTECCWFSIVFHLSVSWVTKSIGLLFKQLFCVSQRVIYATQDFWKLWFYENIVWYLWRGCGKSPLKSLSSYHPQTI